MSSVAEHSQNNKNEYISKSAFEVLHTCKRLKPPFLVSPLMFES